MDLLNYFRNGFTYEQYLADIENRIKTNVTNTEDSDSYLKYYSLGLQRMKRINKTFKLSSIHENRIRNTKNNFYFLIITEGWCGDASQVLPILEKLASALTVKTRYILRDNNLDLMENYKTNGAISIPIIIAVAEDGKELFHFGPRTAYGMSLLEKFKKDPSNYSEESFHKDLQQYYNKNKGTDIINELLDSIDQSM